MRTTMLLLLMMLTAATAWAQEAIDGLTYNSAGGYYEINDEQDLIDLATYVNAGHDASGKTFKQTQPITMTDGNFTPIGIGVKTEDKDKFAGTYDGGGYTISGLTVSHSSAGVGFFCYVRYGTVKNVILVSPNVTNTKTDSTADLKVGALIGYTFHGIVENCLVISPTLNATGNGDKYYGAIVGESGSGYDEFTNCCYYTDNASLAGIGKNPTGDVSRAYTLNLPDGVTASGTHYTYNNVDYYASGTTVTLSDLPSDDPGVGYRYAYIYGGNAISGTTLTMPDADVTVNVAIVPIDWATVNQGTQADPYMIYNKDQLLLLAHRVNGTHGETRQEDGFSGKYFKLGADIEFTYDPNEGDDYVENYEAIGRLDNNPVFSFKGKFDGDDKTVSGIRLRKTGNGTANSGQGLFGSIGVGADIHDVHVTDARIKGYQNVGGIVGKGESDSKVRNCTVTESDITATSNILYGTIRGYSLGTLQNNYYRHCTVNGNDVTSGVGCNGADVTSSNGAVPLYLVTPATGVTIQTTMADDLGFSYDSDNDGIPENYWRAGAELTLATTGIATPAQGYRYAYIYDGNAISGTTLTVANQDANVSTAIRSDGQSHSVTYMKADGTTDDAQAIALDETMTSLSEGWYFVGKDINYTQTVTLTGDVILILCNGKTMTVNTSGIGIYGGADDLINSKDLTIYGQTAQGGTLSVTAGGEGIWCRDITINSGTVNATTGKWRTITAKNLLTINGGVVTATNTANDLYAISGDFGLSINGGQVTATGNSGNIDAYPITFGYTNASDFITFKGISSTSTVKIADGKAMTDGENIYDDQTESATLKALTNKTLRPVTYTVSFDITNDDNDPASQTILHGSKATEPTVATRTGYTFSGWKNGETAYDFNTVVTSNLTLTASWTAHTYTVAFDKNGGTGDAMANQDFTYDEYKPLTANTYTAPTNYAFGGWNTKADGTGTSYSDEKWVENLTAENGATVTLYAQWKKDIDKWCTATVPDQTLDGGSYIYYKFESANYGNATIGEEVKDGNTLLTLGTDYKFGQVYFYGTDKSCTDEINKVGDHFTVEINGIGDYAGTTTAHFYIVSPAANGTWGDLTWNIDSDGNFTITGSGAMNTTTQGNYDWYSKASGIRTITIGEGITTVAAEAFAGTSQMNYYSNVQTVSLPSTLTSIGARAFAYSGCTAINIPASVTSIGDGAFNQCTSLTSVTLNGAVTVGSNAFPITATVTVTDGLCLYNGTEGLSGDVTDMDDVNGNTLRPCSVINAQTAEGVNGFWTTYYNSTENLKVDEDTKVYKAAVSGSTVILTEITDRIITAGQGVVLKSTHEDIIAIPVTNASADSYSGNQLDGSDTGGEQDGYYKYFVLSKPSGKALGFYKLMPGVFFSAHKAFIKIYGTLAPNRDFFGFEEEEPAGIASPQPSPKGEGAWYSITGVKLNGKPTTKGIYIHNGRKEAIR